jgi:hypothetical protein
MPIGPAERYDFFLSRRDSVAAIAREVTDVLTEKGYRVVVQDYDIPLAASFIEKMHEAVSNSRDLVILFTHDYMRSPYTRKEFTSFEAERAQSQEQRHIIVLRCEDVPLRGLLADNVYQDLVGVEDPEERKRRIIAAAERHSQAAPPPPRPFIGVPPRIASFTGRSGELDRLDAILMQDKPAAVTQASVGRAAVQGMGGVGKTSLAIEYAHRYRNLYAGVCWYPAETNTGLLSALATLHDLRVNEYAGLDQPFHAYQRCRQTQKRRCDKYHRVGRHLCQKLDHLSPPWVTWGGASACKSDARRLGRGSVAISGP